MRTLSGTLDSAIDTASSYRTLLRAEIEPSRFFATALTSDYPWAGADPIGIQDDITVQTLAYHPTAGAVTFFSNGAVLCYSVAGSSSITITGISLDSGPSYADDYLYYAVGSTAYRAPVNWSAVAARSASPLDAPEALGTASETILAVQAISSGSSGMAALILDGDGGYRAAVCNENTVYPQAYRFMFPRSIDYTSGSSAAEKSMTLMVRSSAAAMLDGQVFIYLSNSYDGTVQGVSWDPGTAQWSDIFTAVPTQLTESMCEFRACNAVTRGGRIYLTGLFHRTENAETDRSYTLILTSQDGRIFSIDRFSMVTTLGYRFSAAFSDTHLYLGHCNRITSGSLPYSFDGNRTSGHMKLLVPMTDILSFQDNSNQTATLVLAAGNEQYLDSALIEKSARVSVYSGLYTSAGQEEILYGTYIINEITAGLMDGKRMLALSLIADADWRLAGQTNPYYAEYFSKSSLYDPATDDSGRMYVAPSTTRYDQRLIADLWNGTDIATTDDAEITATMNVDGGALTDKVTSGAHKIGIASQDLMTANLNLHDYPLVTSGSVGARLYGWSHDESPGGADNDLVRLAIWTKNIQTKVVTYRQSAGGHFPNTYPASAAGEHPLSQTVLDVPINDVIIKVGMTAQSAHGTDFLPAAVELMSGVEIPLDYADSNTGWSATPDKGYKLPTGNRPYINFAQEPYDAWNFRVAARFNCTVAVGSGVGGYPHGIGLVGLATDGANYLVGRVDYNRNKIQIVKVRNAVETILVEAAPSIALTDWFNLMFEHRDGDLILYQYNESTFTWIEVLRYVWTYADGWMVTDYSAAKKVGIYGNLSGPWFRMVGYDPTGIGTAEQDETSRNADGLPFIPGYSVTDFPTSGTVRIGNSKFTYTGKIDMAAPRGPYQYRQNGWYSPPYGDGAGLELLDFDWTGTTNMAGKLLAMDDGSSYLIDHSLWQIWITTSGNRVDLTNRSRQYSLNPHIDTMIHSMDSRVYITGGLTGINKISGEDEYYGWGDVCTYAVSGEVYCRWFYGASGESDATLQDLIGRICQTAGAQVSFPGDLQVADFSGSQSLPVLEYVEGVDLRFTTTGDFTISTNVQKPAGTSGLQLAAAAAGADLVLTFTLDSASEVLSVPVGTGSHAYRFLMHDNFATLYRDGIWVHTYSVEELVYTNQTNLTLAGGSFSGVRLIELADWREAIYIDLESDAASALREVIQERPVESYTRSDGSMVFWLERTRDVVAPLYSPRSHEWSRNVPPDGASDAIVYSMKDVRCVQNMAYAQRYGFATKIVRCPNLHAGAVRAARILLKRICESGTPHQLTIRPDYRIEAGDQLNLSYTATGTGRVVSTSIVVEQVNLNFNRDGQSEMQITGREAL